MKGELNENRVYLKAVPSHIHERQNKRINRYLFSMQTKRIQILYLD